ncbi:MAG: hypothetical protein KC584_07090, partial [Nitrospira sp.]|nr:hypothetical protein [Nitrospira sp.]
SPSLISLSWSFWSSILQTPPYVEPHSIRVLKQCQQASFKFLILKGDFKQICKLRLVVYK